MTSSVSGKRANQTAPIARAVVLGRAVVPCRANKRSCFCRTGTALTPEVETGFEPVYTALQAVASPLGHSTEVNHQPAVTTPSGRRDSNPRPSPWQGDALPAALRPQAAATKSVLRRVENSPWLRRQPNRGRRIETHFGTRSGPGCRPIWTTVMTVVCWPAQCIRAGQTTACGQLPRRRRYVVTACHLDR